MRVVQSLFLVCIILFTNFNLHIYQNWCHGENIGYTLNSKKFELPVKNSSKSEKEIPSFNRDLCCKDILVQSNENYFYSLEKNLSLSTFSITGILPNFNWDFTDTPRFEKVKALQLYPNPPPLTEKLFKLYCNFTFYG